MCVCMSVHGDGVLMQIVLTGLDSVFFEHFVSALLKITVSGGAWQASVWACIKRLAVQFNSVCTLLVQG